MKTSLAEEIYELIKSLTASEKRYFKMFTKFQVGSKSYLALFDLIERQKQFHEKIITQKFLQHHKATNFPAIKKYLFEQIIASLKSFGAYKDLDSDHTDLIETYKVLHSKGLYGQSARLLRKIKNITLEDDAFIRHYYVLLLEYKMEMNNLEDPYATNITRIFDERKKILAIIQNYSFVGDIYTLQRIHLRKKLYCRNKKDKQELTTIVAPLLETTEKDMLSRTALGLRNMALCDYYMATGQLKKAFDTSTIYLELRKSAGRTNKVETQTISEYGQHLWLCVRSGFYAGFEENLAKYKSFIDEIHDKDKYAVAYERWFNYIFIYYNRIGDFTRAADFLNMHKAQYAGLEKIISMKSKITLWYFTAYNFYALQDYKRSLRLLQKIMNGLNQDVEEFIFSKLLMMFIHYDLQNFELLEYQVRSAQRLMEKKNRLYGCEKLVLDFFRNTQTGDSKKLQQEKLLILLKKVDMLFKKRQERSFSFYFDIRSWIESKLKNKTFAEVVAYNHVKRQR